MVRGPKVLLVMTSVVSAGYYLNVIRVMFMRPRPEGAAAPPAMGPLTRTVLAVTVLMLLGLGVLPSRLARWSRGSTPLSPTPTLSDTR